MCTVIIGGGAAGMMAAYSATKLNKKVILIEKNEKLGKKIYITGKGRCNLTANVTNNEFLNSVVTNSKFLYGAINTFSTTDLMILFEENGFVKREYRSHGSFHFTAFEGENTGIFAIFYGNIKEINITT